MLYSWNNRLARRLRSQGPVGNSNSAIDKFISLPVEIQLQVVPHLSPDDLIKLIRILNAYDPSNSLCSAVDIIERPSDLNRRFCKPIKVIFITSLFKSESQYQTLVKRSQKSLNFVLMRGAEQDSPSLVWLPKFLTDETIGHRTKIHVSGHIQSLDFRDISITSCELYSESLARLEFRRCDANGPGEFKLVGKLTRETQLIKSSQLDIIDCSQRFINKLNMDELWSIRDLNLSCPSTEISVNGMRLNFQGYAKFHICLKSLKNCVFLGEKLIVQDVDRNTEPRSKSNCIEIIDLKAPFMRYMDVGFQGNFSPFNIQAGRLEYVTLQNVSGRHPQIVQEHDDYSFLNRVRNLKLHGLYDPSLLLKCKISRRIRLLEFCMSGVDPDAERSLLGATNEVLVTSRLTRRSDSRMIPFIRYS